MAFVRIFLRKPFYKGPIFVCITPLPSNNTPRPAVPSSTECGTPYVIIQLLYCSMLRNKQSQVFLVSKWFERYWDKVGLCANEWWCFGIYALSLSKGLNVFPRTYTFVSKALRDFFVWFVLGGGNRDIISVREDSFSCKTLILGEWF